MWLDQTNGIITITLWQFVPGLPILQEPEEEDLVADPDIELSSFSAEVANINKNLDKAKTTSNGKGLNVFHLGLFFLLKQDLRPLTRNIFL